MGDRAHAGGGQTMTVAEAAVPMSVCERQTKRILVGFRREGMSVPELSRNPVIISEWGPSHTLCTMVVVSLRGRPCPVQPEELRLNPNAAPSVPEAEAVDLGGPL